MPPLLSVIIPAHNEEDAIGISLNALVNQSYRNFEIIVVNDGSNDKTRGIVKRFVKQNNFVHLINFSKGHSAAFARNRGVEAAKGKYLVFVDADIVVGNDFLSKIKKSTPFQRLSRYTLGHKPQTFLQKAYNVYNRYHYLEHHSQNWAFDAKLFKKFWYNEDMFYYEDNDLNRRMDKEAVKTKKGDIIVYHIDVRNFKDFFRQRKWQGRSLLTRQFSHKIKYFAPCFFPPIMIYLFFKYWTTIRDFKSSMSWILVDFMGRYISLVYFILLTLRFKHNE